MNALQQLCILLVIALACTSCSRQNPQDLKEKSAQATAELKRDAKAVASGVREGWGKYKTEDLNSATKEQLLTLPGINEADANRIIAARPYNRPDDLVTRHILSRKKYDRISDLLKVKKPVESAK
ncbi:MAG TPA: helix-hairpin-helix domain-containing protein [Terriglobales bacterium]